MEIMKMATRKRDYEFINEHGPKMKIPGLGKGGVLCRGFGGQIWDGLAGNGNYDNGNAKKRSDFVIENGPKMKILGLGKGGALCRGFWGVVWDGPGCRRQMCENGNSKKRG